MTVSFSLMTLNSIASVSGKINIHGKPFSGAIRDHGGEEICRLFGLEAGRDGSLGVGFNGGSPSTHQGCADGFVVMQFHDERDPVEVVHGSCWKGAEIGINGREGLAFLRRFRAGY